jgi:hypothetical protein
MSVTPFASAKAAPQKLRRFSAQLIADVGRQR